MSWEDATNLHRTAKIFLDTNRASSPEEARAILEGLALQIHVGPNIAGSAAAQAALATVINCGQRAFLGGVLVKAEDDCVLTEGWIAGHRLSDAVDELGGRIVDALNSDLPTLVIGDPTQPPIGSIVLWATWAGWAGGLVEDPAQRLRGDATALAGVVAGALGISETFQHAVGSVRAARRDVGLSLWRPDLNWRDPEANGPRLRWLPSSFWLLGLGHLGQGYAWSLGWLPYATPTDVTVYLMDTDKVIDGNHATGLLLRRADVDRRKTRVVADRLEHDLGIRSAIIERRFDADTWPTGDEPRLALAGFDDPAPRRQLGGTRSGQPRFGRVIDGGLGAGPIEYLGIRLYTFPSQLDPTTTFAEAQPAEPERRMAAPYRTEIERLVTSGADLGDATCGMIELSGITIAAAFVGATAGALAIADVLRHLHDGVSMAVLSLDLRSPQHIDTAPNPAPGSYFNPGSIRSRQGTGDWTAE